MTYSLFQDSFRLEKDKCYSDWDQSGKFEACNKLTRKNVKKPLVRMKVFL